MPRFSLKTLLIVAAVVPIVVYCFALHAQWTSSFGCETVVLPSDESFMLEGQTYWRLILGIAGGCLVSCLYRRRHSQASAEVTNP